MSFIDIHLLQAVPLANLNRDELGFPKVVVYGGVERTRVSSQCWKRAARLDVEEATGERAVRTRRVAASVAARLSALGWPADLADFAGAQVLAAAGKGGLSVEKDREGGPGLSSALMFLPDSAIGELADLAAGYRDELEKAKDSKKQNARPVLPADEVNDLLCSQNGIVRLFGRMLAEVPGGEVDGAVQVAHAFTVHPAATEIDFFTAVDDVSSGEDVASGHLNTGQFAAGVLYRYANIDTAGLLGGLGGVTAAAAELAGAFLRAFATAMPTGKRTATAPHTLPDLVYVAVRGRPVSLAAAFEIPVHPGPDGGYGHTARVALDGYAAALSGLWGDTDVALHGYATTDPAAYGGLGTRHGSFAGLLAAAVGAAYPAEVRG